MVVNNEVKLVVTFINLTCIIELKIYVSWNYTLLDYSVSEQDGFEVCIVRQVQKNTERASCIWVIHTKEYNRVLFGLIEIEYFQSDKQIRDWVVSSLYTPLVVRSKYDEKLYLAKTRFLLFLFSYSQHSRFVQIHDR